MRDTLSAASRMAAMLGVSAIALSAAMPAAAQAPSQPVLEEIVVTAQKRSENLQTVPITVNVVTAAQASASGVTSSMAIGSIAPGVVLLATPGTPALFIRGVGSQNTAPGEEGSNALYVDGVYYATTRAMIFDFNNIERIEVLKGPQGTLFGRNATGGLINIITRDPSHAPVLKGSVGYGNYKRSTASLYASGGLSETIAADIALNLTHQADGFGHNVISGREIYKGSNWGFRSKVLWTPTDETRVTLAGDYLDDDNSFTSPRYVIPGAVNIEGRTTAGLGRYDIRHAVPYPNATYEGYGGSLKVEQGLGWSKLVSISAYRQSLTTLRYDNAGTQTSVQDIYYHQPEHQFTQEVQLQSPSESRLQWITGAFYMKSQMKMNPLRFRGSAFAPLGGVQNLIDTYDTTSVAVFAQTTAPLGEATNVTAGVRYTKDKRHLVGRNERPNLPPPANVANVTDSRASYDKVTYKLALDHKLTDDALVFASLSRGFKAGVYNATNLANPPAAPETIDAYEAGIKSELLDNRLRVNLSGFYYKYKDIQLNQVQGATNFLFNAARARMYGLDLDVLAAPVEGLTLRGSANLLDGKYQDFPGAPASLPIRDPTPVGWVCPATSLTAVGGNKTCVITNAAGNTTTRSPKLTFNLTAEYTKSISYGSVSASASLYHNSGYFIDADNRVRQKSYDLLSAQIGWKSPDERYGVKVWGRNLSNETVYTNISTSSSDNVTLQPPRMYGITFDYSFQ